MLVLRFRMEFEKCHQCGRKFPPRSLKRVDDKLKKNSPIFIETFMKLNIKFPMFCKKCQKLWLKLENIRGKINISKFIADRKSEMNNKDEDDVPFVSDDAQVKIPSSSEFQEKVVNNDQNSIPRRVITRYYNQFIQTEELTEPEPLKFGEDIVNEREAVPKTEFEDQVNDCTLSGPPEFENDFMRDKLSNEEKDQEKNIIKDYNYWKLLANKTFCSDGIGAKTREEFKYYSKKMREAEQNGTAEDDEKNYNYWKKLFIDKYKSEGCDKECKEDLEYFYQKMHETKMK